MKHPVHTKLLTLVKTERAIKIEILNFLEQAEKIKYYLPKHNSLFEYCRKELGYTDSESQRRIDAMRVLRRHPELKTKVKEDKISASQLNELNKVEQVLKKEGKAPLLETVFPLIENKSVRETQEILRKEFEIPVRKKIVLNVEDETYKKWVILRNRNFKLSEDKLMNLMIDATNKLQDEPVTVRREVQASRAPTANLRKTVIQRAGGKCEWMGCGSPHNLHVDHIIPWSRGGKTELSNLQVLCQTHNGLKGGEFCGHQKTWGRPSQDP